MTIDAKIAWSPTDQANVYWTSNLRMEWENEFSGGGPGLMAVRATDTSDSGAIQQIAGVSLLAASSLLSLLMW